MIYAICIIAGVAAGLASGGSIKKFAELRINKAWLVLSAFALQLLAQLLGIAGWSFPARHSLEIQAVVFALLAAAFWANRKHLGICIAGAGFLLNAAVMLANGGKMPVDYGVLESANLTQLTGALQKGIDGKHILAGETTRLAFLGDIMHPPGILGFMMQIVSLGDLVFAAGMFVFVCEVVSGRIYGFNRAK